MSAFFPIFLIKRKTSLDIRSIKSKIEFFIQNFRIDLNFHLDEKALWVNLEKTKFDNILLSTSEDIYLIKNIRKPKNAKQLFPQRKTTLNTLANEQMGKLKYV